MQLLLDGIQFADLNELLDPGTLGCGQLARSIMIDELNRAGLTAQIRTEKPTPGSWSIRTRQMGKLILRREPTRWVMIDPPSCLLELQIGKFEDHNGGFDHESILSLDSPWVLKSLSEKVLRLNFGQQNFQF